MCCNPQFVFYTQKSIQSDALCNVLKNRGALDIVQVSEISELECFVRQGSAILILDVEVPEIDAIRLLTQKLWKQTNKLILANVQPDYDYQLVRQWKNCYGIFPQDTSFQFWIAGAQKVASGEYWFSRQVMADLIASYREDMLERQNAVSQKPMTLTKREEDILKLILQGESNAKIAELLFLSESTVKTHLYNAFKKIDVKNRRQARDWAREQLFLQH
ncbi:LuxR C-terminal-related transcriptional regulator [Photobacterium sp. 1_MG-2023]|uniref:LuxR C-terminal-related transcriptional regulator n=1 Tax=Photobacterium sp. 1_MG-2023 TaxID=3062646 RepID=UPI0026E1E356|nr:LuxR C-terminal-related transcriptional regulator [Photobacterium sp. 1_MG-2023]MDO6708545.1 LuxR C-terminal-related transcriptional regulator [Photobacterium sp. 1_MG-2023]